MGVLLRILIAAACLGAAVVFQNYRELSRSLPIPELNPKEYWGVGNGKSYKENTAVLPFDIAPKAEIIADLKTLLDRPLKLHEPLEGVGFEYGFNSKYLEKVVKYWRDSYLPKWNEREKYLKKFSHFQTQIQGLRIHFIHEKPVKANGKKVIPLLILHGWPGTVREFYDIIPLLTTPNAKSDYVFEVIAPSLPGYGWSQGSSKINLGTAQIAVIMRNLMLRLGHDKFIVQGGDWGSVIGSAVATLYPNNVLGYHSNMCGALHPISQMKMFVTRLFSNFFIKSEHKEFYPSLGQKFANILEESGYMHLQSTKPDTIGTALSYNPVGLAAYILEKFSTWTNGEYKKLPDGGLTKRFTLDALLDNVMIYYITNSITTSQRLYAEQFTGSQFALQIDRVHVTVPAGCARFRHDLMHSTDCELKHKFVNLVHSSHYSDGGHFAAFEKPQELYNDIMEFTKKALNNEQK